MEILATSSSFYGSDFGFYREQMNEMLGIKDWDQKVIKVFRVKWDGRTELVGEVKVQFSSESDRGIGQKLSPQWGDWSLKDTIYLSSCVSTGKRSNDELIYLFLF